MLHKKEIGILIFILVIAAFLRFYNLMHDAPYFFNPDERNMAIATSQFRLPSKLSEIPSCLLSQFSILNSQFSINNCNLDPHFFAYGQFPLYLAYFSDQTYKLVSENLRSVFLSSKLTDNRQLTTDNYLSTSLPSAIFWLRFWSALSSTFIVLLVYLITNAVTNKFQIQSTKLQTNSKFKAPNYKQFGIWDLGFGHYAAILAAFTPGLIQAAHFGTTESLLTFFFLASLYISISYLSNLSHLRYLLFSSLMIGLALGTKFTGLFLFIPSFLTLIIQIIKLSARRIRRRKKTIGLLGYLIIGLLIFIGSILFSILSSPYNLIEFQNFKSTVFGYEADVVTGRYQAFYTRQFVDTIPIIFQSEKIFPYALGWPIFILGTLGFLLISLQLIKRAFLFIIYRISSKLQLKIQNYKNSKASPKETILERELNAKTTDMAKPGYLTQKERFQDKRRASEKFVSEGMLIIILCSFLIYFLPNAFLFAKWTRFMTPIFPFFTIFAGYFLFQVHAFLKILYCKIQRSKFKDQNLVKNSKLLTLRLALSSALCILNLLPGVAFISIYILEDVRITASRWILENIPDKSYILFETANVIDIPVGIPDKNLPQKTYTLVSFDFYHIDENELLFEQLLSHLEKADYFFIPSRRIFVNHLRLSKKYPLITKYYQLLFSGRLGFEKVVEFSSFPSFTLYALRFTLPDEQAEETFTVFDHPVIRIYRKTKSFTKEQYRSLFKTNKL